LGQLVRAAACAAVQPGQFRYTEQNSAWLILSAVFYSLGESLRILLDPTMKDR
jgi:hypothetical protein